MHDSVVVDFIKVAGIAFGALFPIVNPVGDAPIFLSLARRYPRSVRQLLARKIALYGFALLAGSLLFGTEILSFFGITLVAMQIAGGLVVAVTGWGLLTHDDSKSAEKQGKQEAATLGEALGNAFFPLTLPITVGPGSISVAITLGAHLRSMAGLNQTGHFNAYPRHFLGALTGMAAVCLLVALCYGNAERLEKMLGKSGTNILIRLSAFILLAIGVQIMWNGLSAGLPKMFEPVISH
jgi:multiple antibiotic resistance protein